MFYHMQPFNSYNAINAPCVFVRFATKRSKDPTITSGEKQKSQVANRTTSRKPRTKFTPAQRQVLEDAFPMNPIPSHEVRATLAAQLGVDTESVDNWYASRFAHAERFMSRIQ